MNMKTVKTLFIVGLAVGVAFVVADRMAVKRLAVQETAGKKTDRLTKPEQTGNQPPPAVTRVPSPETPSSEEIGNTFERAPAVHLATTNAQQQVATQSKQTQKPKDEVKDPVARVALSFVGADADAEQYWMEAIFDPSLSDQEREDLMEDLNEEGLSDPRHPGPEDLQLIANRIVTIEKVFPHADKFMAPHLAEAYKDLWDLLYGLEPQ